MAGPTTITNLTAATSLTGAEVLPMDQTQSGSLVTVKASVAGLTTLQAASTALTGAELFTNVTGSTTQKTTLNQLVTQLTASGNPAAADLFYSTQSGSARKTQLSSIAAFSNYYTGGGTANAQTVTLAPAPTAYYTGMRVVWLPAVANTGAVTLNANALGAKNIFANGSACVGGELQTNLPAIAVYDGTQFQLTNPEVHANANASNLPTSAGTANAQTVTNSFPFTSLRTGQYQWFLPGNANTGATTLAVDGLTAKNVFAYGSALLGGELSTTIPALVKYDGTQWNLINPQDATGSFTITLTGMTATTTGTINWRIVKGKYVTVWAATQISGTSNITVMTGTGIPAALVSSTAHTVVGILRDNGGNTPGSLGTTNTTTWTFGAGASYSASGFTASSTKGWQAGSTFSYSLD